MPLDAMEREVIIRRHEEITVDGITRTRKLYARLSHTKREQTASCLHRLQLVQAVYRN